MSEVVRVEIDAAQLQEISNTLDFLMSRVRETKTGLSEAKQSTLKLDTATRSIVYRMPVLREALVVQQRIQMLNRANEAALAGGAGALAGLGPIAAALLLADTVVKLAERIDRLEKENVQVKGDLETMIREGRDLSRAEWLELKVEVGHANNWIALWDEIGAGANPVGALGNYIRAKIVDWFAGRALWEASKQTPLEYIADERLE